MTDWTQKDIPAMTGRTVIITGANSGIGLATAHALATAGARVVFAVRTVEKGKAAASTIAGETEVRELDLASLDSVRAFAASWSGEIDILINNAGMSPSTLERTADGFETNFGVNHLGHFALTNLLLQHITGRIVTVASQAERMGRIDFDDLNWERRPYQSSRAYGQSKLANLLFTAELQRRLSATGSGVRAMAAHPGFVATNIYTKADGSAATGITAFMLRHLAQNAESGALPTLYAAVADIPGDSFAGPKHFVHMRGAPELIGRSASARDADVAKRLWDVSEQLTGVRYPLQLVS